MCDIIYQTRKTVCDISLTVQPKTTTKGFSLVHLPNVLLQVHFQVLVFIVIQEKFFFFPGNGEQIIPKVRTRLDPVPGRGGTGVVALSEARVEETKKRDSGGGGQGRNCEQFATSVTFPWKKAPRSKNHQKGAGTGNKWYIRYEIEA